MKGEEERKSYRKRLKGELKTKQENFKEREKEEEDGM